MFTKYKTGAIPEPVDPRDHRLEEVFSAPLVDWNKGYDIEEVMGRELPTRDQKQSSSCVSQAWAYYSEVLDYLESKQWMRQSARFIYSQIYLPNGGAYIRSGGQVLTDQGEVPEVIVPDKPTEAGMRDKSDVTVYDKTIAKTLLKASYASFEVQTIDYLASIIQAHHGFVSGVRDNFKHSNWRGEIVKMGDKANNGHCLYFGKFKYIAGKKYLGFKNSWGNIGDKGWQWLGEEWIKAGRFFNPKTIVDLPNDVERPKEKPNYYFINNLKVGMKNMEVKALQERLRYEGTFNYPTATGYFGGITLRAVKAYQIIHKIPATGFVGPMTRAELNKGR